MRKIVAFMHASLDGFVAGINGELNWVKLDNELFSFVGARIAKTDTALYGRVTYQMMEAYWPTAADKPNPSNHDIEHSKWYKKVNKVVLSKTLNANDLVNTKVIGHNFIEEIIALKQTSGSEILLFGSPAATHSLMAEDLIDEYWLFVNPILLSEGIPLFNKIRTKHALSFISSKAFPSGVVCLQYMRDSKSNT
jgi:dihydrofolate reductase